MLHQDRGREGDARPDRPRRSRLASAVVVVSAALGCGAAERPVEPAHARTPAASSAPSSAIAPPAVSEPPPATAQPSASRAPRPQPAPTAEPKESIAKIELRIPATVVAGEGIEIELANVDDHDHLFFVHGASNGCGAFRFDVSFRSASGVFREDRSMEGCGQGLVPARWLRIPRGESLKWTQPTDAPMEGPGIPKASGLLAQRAGLRAGKYVLAVRGAGISVEGRVEVKGR